MRRLESVHWVLSYSDLMKSWKTKVDIGYSVWYASGENAFGCLRSFVTSFSCPYDMDMRMKWQRNTVLKPVYCMRHGLSSQPLLIRLLHLFSLMTLLCLNCFAVFVSVLGMRLNCFFFVKFVHCQIVFMSQLKLCDAKIRFIFRQSSFVHINIVKCSYILIKHPVLWNCSFSRHSGGFVDIRSCCSAADWLIVSWLSDLQKFETWFDCTNLLIFHRVMSLYCSN